MAQSQAAAATLATRAPAHRGATRTQAAANGPAPVPSNGSGQPAGAPAAATPAVASMVPAPAPTGGGGQAPAPGGQPPVAPDPKPVPQPVFSVQANSGSWSLQVAPPGLGPVHVHLDLRGGSLDTRFLVGDAGAKSALESGLGALRVNLTGQGVNVGSLNVGLSHGGGGHGEAHGSPYDRGGRSLPPQLRTAALSPGRSPPTGRRSALNLLG